MRSVRRRKARRPLSDSNRCTEMNPSLLSGPADPRGSRARLVMDVWRLSLGSIAILWLLNDLLPSGPTAPRPRDPRLIYALPAGLMLGFWLAAQQKHPTRR